MRAAGHRGPRTAAPLRPESERDGHAGSRSPRSSDRGSIAAEVTRDDGHADAAESPRSSDRGSIAASTRRRRACHRGPRTAAPLRRSRRRRRPTHVGVSPRSSDRGSIAAAAPTRGAGRHVGWSPRSSDRGSIAAWSRRGRGTWSRGGHRGPRTAAPLRPANRAAHARTPTRVTAVLGPRLHCGNILHGVQRGRGCRHRGPRTAAPLRPAGRRRRPRLLRRHRGPRTAAPLRHRPPGPRRGASLPVTAVLGPRLHCGVAARVSRTPWSLQSPRSSDRGYIAAR